MICVLLGGRVSEELFLKEITTGAANDLEKATEIARRMVCEWGMSENLGPQTFEKQEYSASLVGKDYIQKYDFSPETAVKIDQEIKKIIEENYNKAMEIIKDNTEKVKLIAETLLEKEVLNAEQIKMLCEVGKLKEDVPQSSSEDKAKEAQDKEQVVIKSVLSLNEN